MNEDKKKTVAMAAGAIFAGLMLAVWVGWWPTSGGSTFGQADGTVLACYSEFAGIRAERVRKIDWIEFTGTVEGRLRPLLSDETLSIDQTTTKDAELLIEIAATHPIKDRDKLKQYAQDLEPLIDKIRG